MSQLELLSITYSFILKCGSVQFSTLIGPHLSNEGRNWCRIRCKKNHFTSESTWDSWNLANSSIQTSWVLTNVVSENSRHLNIAPPLIHDFPASACCKVKKGNFSEQETVFKKNKRRERNRKTEVLGSLKRLKGARNGSSGRKSVSQQHRHGQPIFRWSLNI